MIISIRETIEALEKKQGRLPTKQELALSARISEGAAFKYLRIYRDEKKEPVVKQKVNITVPLPLRIIILGVSVVAMVVSTYYSFMWLGSYMVHVLAWALAVSLVLFSATGFTLAKYLKIGTSILTKFMGSFVLMFSIVCTISGQIQVSATRKLEGIDTLGRIELDTLEQQIISRKEDLKQTQKLLSEFDTIESRQLGGGNYYYNTMQDRNLIQADINTLSEQYRKKLAEKAKEKAAEPDPFMEFLRSLNSDKIALLKFIMYVIPAIFLDIIAPLGLYIFFETRRKK